MKSIRLALAAATLMAVPVAVQAYDKPPKTPPSSSGGSSGGSSSGGPVKVPAPAAIGLFAAGVAGIAIARRRRR